MKPWVRNKVPQGLCKRVEGQEPGPQTYSHFEGHFATCPLSRNIPFRVSASEV